MKLPGIKIVRKGGREYLYRRAGGKLVRLPDRDDPRFLSAYNAAGGTKPAAVLPRSVAAVCQSYMDSDEWRSLKSSTRQMRRRIIEKIAEKGMAAQVAGLTADHIYNDMMGLKPAAAFNRLRVWRVLLGHAAGPKLRWIPRNIALDVEKPVWREHPHEPWFEEQVAAFRAHWPMGSRERLAFEVIHWFGARVCDARQLGFQKVRNGCVEYDQQKTGGHCTVPFTDPLPDDLTHFEPDRAMLLDALAGADNMTWIVTAYGAPRSEKAISQWFSAACREAGLDGYTAHGLRKTRAIMLAEAGWSDKRIGAWTGHESLKEIQAYTRKARQRNLIFGSKAGR